MYSWLTVPRADGRVPHEGHLAEEAQGIEVEVRLGVGVMTPGRAASRGT